MPKASIIVPAYNAVQTLPETLTSLLQQSYTDFEIVIVNDGSHDTTPEIAASFQFDPRVKIAHQANRGLAGARNTGIAAAKGEYVGFCDADDLWEPEKLAAHVAHLDTNPAIGLSYTGSALIDDESELVGVNQRPRLRNVTAAHVLKRNPIGNGSSLVMRRAALKDLAYRPDFETERDWVFDETFRQSEDIECWVRLMLTTDWQIEGIPGLLTCYRVNASGLSAALDRQLESWERMIQKLRPFNEAFFETHEAAARAYQYRYLARRAVSNGDPHQAWDLVCRSMAQSTRPLIEEPVKTASTFCAAFVLQAAGPRPIAHAGRVLKWLKTN